MSTPSSVHESVPDPPPLPPLIKDKGYIGSWRETFEPVCLHFAINKNDFCRVKTLIRQKKVDLDYEVFGQTPLVVSIFKEHFDIAFLLIDSGAKLTSPHSHKCRWDRSPIHLAALGANIRLIAKLINKCPDLVHSRCHCLNQTPLLCASMMSHVKAIKLLLSLNSDVNAKDMYGKTSLAKSVEKRCTKAILCLLRHGADANIKDEQGRTCLFFPALRHDVKMVDLILSHTTVDVNSRDFSGKSALHQACGFQYDDFYYLDAIATRDQSHPYHDFPRIDSTSPAEDQMAVVRLLINHGADCNLRDANRKTPLTIAIQHKNMHLCVLLLNNGSEFQNEDWALAQKEWPKTSKTLEFFNTVERVIKKGPYSLFKLSKLAFRNSIKAKKIDKIIKRMKIPTFLRLQLLSTNSHLDE